MHSIQKFIISNPSEFLITLKILVQLNSENLKNFLKTSFLKYFFFIPDPKTNKERRTVSQSIIKLWAYINNNNLVHFY